MRKNVIYYLTIVLLTITFVINYPTQNSTLTLTAYGQDMYQSSGDDDPKETPDDKDSAEKDDNNEEPAENLDNKPDNNEKEENEDGEPFDDGKEETEIESEHPKPSSAEENPALLEGARLFLPANFDFNDTLIEADREIKVTGGWLLTGAITIGESATVKIYSDPESLTTYTITSAADERHFIVNGTLILDNVILDGNDSFGGIHMETYNGSKPVLELNKSTIMK